MAPYSRGDAPISFRGYASGRDGSARVPGEERRYVYHRRVNSHQQLVEVVPLPADAPNTPPVGSVVECTAGRYRLVRVLTPPYLGLGAAWFIQVQSATDNRAASDSVPVDAVMPKPKTVTVKVTGTPEQLDEYKRLMNGELRAKVAGYTVTLVED